MYRKILLTVDGSLNNKCAILEGLTLAQDMNSEVTAIYVLDLSNYAPSRSGSCEDIAELRNEAEETMREVVAEGCNRGINITAKIITGHPIDIIVEESKNYDLVVCGSLGRTGIVRTVMGSVAEKVARLSPCPVLICHNKLIV